MGHEYSELVDIPFVFQELLIPSAASLHGEGLTEYHQII
jgi:hypothetical protein